MIKFSTFEGLQDTTPTRWALPFDELAGFVTGIHQRLEHESVFDGNEIFTGQYREHQDIKDHAPLWSPATFRYAGKRCEADVVSMSCVVYDCDKLPFGSSRKLHERLLEANLQHMIVGTWSDSKTTDSFHCVIPLDWEHPINEKTHNGYSQAKKAVAERFGIDYDLRAGGLSRAYFLPPIWGHYHAHTDPDARRIDLSAENAAPTSQQMVEGESQ